MLRECRVGTFLRRVLRHTRPSANPRASVHRSLLGERFASDGKLSPADPRVKRYLEHVVSEFRSNPENSHTSKHHGFALLIEERIQIVESIDSVRELDAASEDSEMRSLAAEELAAYDARLGELDTRILDSLLAGCGRESCNDVILEVTTGVGGKEAQLFANELWEMYRGHLDHLDFECRVTEMDVAESGGIRHASALVSGARALERLRHEAGVHRVQRVPATERSGRLHTSTVSVAVLPQPSAIEVVLLDKDLKIETKRSSGAGGQSVNTTDSAVRIVHLPTGITVECQTERSQIRNKATAMIKLRARIYERQLNEQLTSSGEMRRRQLGLGTRNEKIRTYNFNQDRVTDHRLADGTLHNLPEFLKGGEALEALQERLEGRMRLEILLEAVSSVNKGG